jgi:hypothetical protein
MAGQPTNRGSIPGTGKRFVSSPKRPGWLSGQPSLLFNANRGAFRRERGRRVKLFTHFNLAMQLRMTAAVPPLPHTTSWCAKGQFYLTLNFPCGASTRFRVKASPYGASQSQWAHHTRQDYSGRVTSPTQRPLLNNTQHPQKTNIHASGGIRIHNPSKRTVEDPRLRPRSHWDWHLPLDLLNFSWDCPIKLSNFHNV